MAGHVKARKKRKPPIIGYGIDKIEIDITKRGKPHKYLLMRRYRKPILVKDVDYTKNPDKISFLIWRNKFNDRLELFYYKNNPKKGFISINGQVMGLNKYDWRRFQGAFMKLGKILGLLK